MHHLTPAPSPSQIHLPDSPPHRCPAPAPARALVTEPSDGDTAVPQGAAGSSADLAKAMLEQPFSMDLLHLRGGRVGMEVALPAGVRNGFVARSRWEIDPRDVVVGERLAVGGFSEVFLGKYQVSSCIGGQTWSNCTW